MSKNVKRLPSGAKLVFPKHLVMHVKLHFQVYAKNQSVATLAGSVELDDIPQLVKELKLRHAEIRSQRKEFRRQYEAAHPNA
jgi:hypothetical protein